MSSSGTVTILDSAAAAERSRFGRVLMFPMAFVLVAVLWEGYKAIGPADGGKLFGVRLLPRTGERSMPHVWDMESRLSQPENSGTTSSVGKVVVAATWYSLRVALAAFVLGTLLGVGIAIVMARFRVVERALMPYLIVSQTVPIIVLAPLIFSLMANASRSMTEHTWLAACALGAFLALFPVAVSTLRGLQSAPVAAVELMDSYAASWWQSLVKLRLPNAVAFIAPALRLAGASAVVGVVVSEISLGLRAGIGRLILTYGQEASTDPPKLFSAVFGAAVLGLLMAALVAGIDLFLMRHRPAEQSS